MPGTAGPAPFGCARGARREEAAACERACSTCAWWDGETMFCHKDPPRVVWAGSSAKTYHPSTRCDDFCSWWRKSGE